MQIQFESHVRDLSHKGLGVIDHPDGRVFFVRGVWPGDKGVFEIASAAEKYSEARLITLTEKSPERVDMPCSFRGTEAGSCGGCPWMMASYSSQLNFKMKRLNHALEKRRVKIDDSILQPLVPSPDIFHYRNRVQLKTNGEKLGYVSEGTSIMAPIDDCLILNDKLSTLFHELKNSLPKDHLRPGENHKWAYVDLDDEMKLEDVVPNKRRPFRQGNTKQNEEMRNWIRNKLLDKPKHWPVIDLFCGSGNFTEILSSLGFENILAVEVQGSALQGLERKQLPGVRILPLDMNEKGSWAKIAKYQPHAKILLTDPPREGMAKRRGLFKYLDNLQEILYISCELDTFSRDCSDLMNTFSLLELTPIDLFPHTPHLEMMAHFLSKR